MTAGERKLARLLRDIRACRICRDAPQGAPLPHEPRPVLRVSTTARLLIASQAPGARVHATGLTFNDRSGDRLREWLGLDRETFYDESRVAIAPMGFCFPGADPGKGDRPPRPECRRTWHDRLFATLPEYDVIVLIGAHACRYHLARLGLAPPRGTPMAEIVRDWRRYAAGAPHVFPLPHPSWRNTGWLLANRWFEDETVPALRQAVRRVLAASKKPAD